MSLMFLHSFKTHITAVIALMAVATGLCSCSDDKSYAELLEDETKYINNYLADQRVIGEVPADSVFITGEDAPFYRMDDDGNVYMRVVTPGTPGDKAEKNELIYFRTMRYALNEYVDGKLPLGDGNAEDMNVGDYNFRFQNYELSSSARWGQGIQLPLEYLPVDAVVQLVIRSQYGLTSEISNVIPYLYTVRYYRSKV